MTHDATAKILVVDDDAELQDLIRAVLGEAGFATDGAGSLAEARQRIAAARPDLLLLDVGLPDGDGLAFCRALRARDDLPIVMLTARAEAEDRVLGLETGADAYLAKPVQPREIVAQVRAVLRRAGGREAAILAFGDWRIDLRRRELTRADGAVVLLSAAEHEILAAFLERPQRVVTRDELSLLVWGRRAEPFDRRLDVRMSRLRRKLERDPDRPTIIRTVRSEGWLFAEPVQPA